MKRGKSGNFYSKILPKITNQIVENYRPERAVLFGSLGSGRISEASDIDLFLIKKTRLKRHIDRVRKAREFLPSEIPIDLIIYTPQKVQKALEIGSYFIEDILKEGRVLYDASF